MAVVRWTFFDPLTLEEYTFGINPNTGGSRQFRKTINYQSTAAADGKTLVFEGRDEVNKMEFSGAILEQGQYDAMVTWFSKRHQIQVTDDLGRQFWIYITSFAPVRQRAIHYPWKHSYTVEYVEVDWP
jgi:hypothetical protein